MPLNHFSCEVTTVRTGSTDNCVTDTVIIGAGPYGLSLAAHLKPKGVDFRIFGQPMHTWLTQMPKGMRLKSEGFASSLYDPEGKFTLAQYCASHGILHADIGRPVPLEVFSAYGLEFQKRFVPQLEQTLVTSLRQVPSGFEVGLETGERVRAQRVVVAAGIGHFGYMPPVLANLPAEFVTHSAEHHELGKFAGKQVVVIGAGASALDIAALLHQAGAAVQLVSRKPVIRFHDPPAQRGRSFMDSVRAPMTGIGAGWKLLFYSKAPHLFHLLPKQFRLLAVKKTLGPAPGWFIKKEVIGKVPFHLGYEITNARIGNGRLRLELASTDGNRQTLETEHVIAATGYKVELRRLSFLQPELVCHIRCAEQSPVLSSYCESSVPGLYFIGTAAANSFGPLMRFACGAGFVARRVSSHLRRTMRRKRAQQVRTPSNWERWTTAASNPSDSD
jgi:thioredoxin reductase